MGAPIRRRLDRYDLLAAIVLLALISGLFWPLMNHLVRGTPTMVPYTDHPAHNAFAAQIRQEGKLILPHPLYHGVLLAVRLMTDHREYWAPDPDARAALLAAGKEVQGEALARLNWRYGRASVITLLLFQYLLALVLWFQLRGGMGVGSVRVGGILIVLIMGLMLAAPIALFYPIDQEFYFGYIGINVWHSPTVLAAKPLALLTFAASLQIFGSGMAPAKSSGPLSADPRAVSLVAPLLLALSVVLGALAKPSFLMALIPAVTCLVFYRGFVAKQSFRWGVLIVCLLLPAGVVLAWQSHMYAALTGGSRARFAPFLTMLSLTQNPSRVTLLFKALLSCAFPLACSMVCRKQFRESLRIQLAWLAFGVGLCFTYLVAESRRTAHGNFLWSAQLALFVLFVESILLLFRSGRGPRVDGRSPQRWWIWLCSAIFLLHVGFGAAYYAHLLNSPDSAKLTFR